jgi:ABC-2 type transport system ATP-binding protein
MSTSCVIETHELSKTYKKIPALRSLDLKVQQNSIFGFQGPNGAGKTTTIKLMLGLIRPTAGRGTVFGMDCIRQSVDIQARVGYLMQEPHFYEYLTARETLRFVASCFFKGPKEAIEGRIDEILEMVDLTNKADR